MSLKNKQDSYLGRLSNYLNKEGYTFSSDLKSDRSNQITTFKFKIDKYRAIISSKKDGKTISLIFVSPDKTVMLSYDLDTEEMIIAGMEGIPEELLDFVNRLRSLSNNAMDFILSL